MTSKKRERTTSKASKRGCRRAEGSRRKLAEAFLADLDRSWQQHGREILDRVRTERPQVYLRRWSSLRGLYTARSANRTTSTGGTNREDVLRRLGAN
jgi:hypothetical protein